MKKRFSEEQIIGFLREADAGLAIGPQRFLEMLGSQFLLGLMVVAPVILGLFAIDLGVAFA